MGVEPEPTPGPGLTRAIQECLAALQGKPRETLRAWLEAVIVESDRELARRVGMTVNTFLQNIVRARKAMTECLRRHGRRARAGPTAVIAACSGVRGRSARVEGNGQGSAVADLAGRDDIPGRRPPNFVLPIVLSASPSSRRANRKEDGMRRGRLFYVVLLSTALATAGCSKDWKLKVESNTAWTGSYGTGSQGSLSSGTIQGSGNRTFDVGDDDRICAGFTQLGSGYLNLTLEKKGSLFSPGKKKSAISNVSGGFAGVCTDSPE